MPHKTAFHWKRKHLLALEDLTVEEITHVLSQADAFKEVSTRSVKKVPAPARQGDGQLFL